jgi:hypothetical protein
LESIAETQLQLQAALLRLIDFQFSGLRRKIRHTELKPHFNKSSNLQISFLFQRASRNWLILAQTLAHSRSGVSKIEARLSYVDDKTLLYLAEVLKVQVQELFPTPIAWQSNLRFHRET